jgi:hypothetical protein
MKSNSHTSHPVGMGLALMTSVLGALFFFRVFKPVVKRRISAEEHSDTSTAERLAYLRRKIRSQA